MVERTQMGKSWAGRVELVNDVIRRLAMALKEACRAHDDPAHQPLLVHHSFHHHPL